MVDKSIQAILENGETLHVEFKSSFQKEVIESVVAFANAKGGKIYIGISDCQEVVGVDINGESIQNYINQIKQNTQPGIIVDIDDYKIENKIVLVVDVKEYPLKPISYKNRYYKRIKNSNHIMSLDEISTWIVHRDYRDSGNSIIKIFDDKIEFFNPGKLYDNLTIEELLSGNYASRTRNRAISRSFKEAGIIERYGSGIARIKDECKANRQKEPIFEEFAHGFRVVLFKEKLKTTQKTTKEKVLEILSTNKKFTREDLAQEIGVSPDTVKLHLSNLQKENRLKRVGGRKDGYWEVI